MTHFKIKLFYQKEIVLLEGEREKLSSQIQSQGLKSVFKNLYLLCHPFLPHTYAILVSKMCVDDRKSIGFTFQFLISGLNKSGHTRINTTPSLIMAA